ncbi:hypothetical protein COV16_00205 [Candidatus Woesearchaeota archaeon CG10_big_fil_rev_8_21_14_0_10_34_8]|jgi:hypothetical protein|nr:MAG: hypothetical protein COV16_00205 [Candidatus Woesearchaeota archaeon CG10_big_fil_rev_8_21_14_0_10_34_8]
MKRGQLLSQPFIYIFALILGALVLVAGFKMIMDLKETADMVEVGEFKSTIESEAKAFYNRGEGSTKSIPISLSGIKFVCFSNPEEKLNCKFKSKVSDEIKSCPGGLKAMNDDKPTFQLRLSKETTDNLWFLPLGTAKKDSFKINFIKPLEGANPLCYQVGSEIIIESKGTHVELR